MTAGEFAHCRARYDFLMRHSELTRRSVRTRPCTWVGAELTLLAVLLPLSVGAADQNDEYQMTLFPTYALTQDKKWIGMGYFGYAESHDLNYDKGYLELGTIWKFHPDAEAWFVLINERTDNATAPDVNEWRPYVGLKNYFAKAGPATFYNYARLEYRMQDVEGAQETEYLRLRERIGVNSPIGRRINAAGSLYGFVDVEPMYRFDRDFVDTLRVRAGFGFVIHEYIRCELIYTMQYTRLDEDDSLEWTRNIYRLNFKLARQKGLLARLAHSDGDD